MDKNKILELEKNKDFINDNIVSAVFGKNKLVFLPLLAGVALLFFVVYALFSGLTDIIGGYPILITLVLTALACFVLVSMVNKSTKAKLLKETKKAPICLAKKIYGNDNQNIYYCIYSVDDKRHDSSFINYIADKIKNIPPSTNDKSEKQVLKLFRPDLANPMEPGKKLPLSFTNDEIVWRKQFNLGILSKELQEEIENNHGQFWAVAINAEYPQVLQNQKLTSYNKIQA